MTTKINKCGSIFYAAFTGLLLLGGCQAKRHTPVSQTNHGEREPTKQATSLSSQITTPARIGRCYMDECSWTRELGRVKVHKNKDGRLLKITIFGGTSSHPNGSYGKDMPIVWDETPHPIYVFCSKNFRQS